MPHRTRRNSVEGLEPRTLFSSAFTNVNVSRLAGNQAEGAITVDPADPSKLFAVSNIDTGDGLLVTTSSDGGATWSPRLIAQDHGALPPACCDPSTAFDSYGNLFLAYLNSTDTAVVLLMSTDGGQAFSIVTQYKGNVDQPTVVAGQGEVWLDYDTGSGVDATGASVTGLGSVGAFAAPKQVPGSGNGEFGDIAIGPSGQVMVTYQKDVSAHLSQVYVNVDPTGVGGKFAKATLVTTTNVVGFDYIPAQDSRGIDSETGLAFDTSGGAFNGRVYLVYTTQTPSTSGNTDIDVRYSDDQGLTWSDPIRGNDDPGVNSQFLPRISADSTSGLVAVSWYDARNDLGDGATGDTDNIPNDDVEFYAAVITPQADGLIVSANQQISAGVSDAYDANSDTDLGDYSGLAFYDGTVHPLWFDNSNSTGDNPNGTLNQLNAYTASANASSFVGGSLFLGGLTDPSGVTASLDFASGLNSGMVRTGKTYIISILYSNGVVASSLGNDNLLITGPDGFQADAVLTHAKSRKDGSILATYQITNPTGKAWNSSEIGNYIIQLNSNQVQTTNDQSLQGGILGDFVIAAGLGNGSKTGGNGPRHHKRQPDDD